MDFQFIPLHRVLVLNILKQYVNGLFRFLFAFQVNDFKISKDLYDFSSFSKLVVQQPPILLLQLTTCFFLNKKN